jgi:hypothetical protein
MDDTVKDVEDEEETKAKVEKMQLGGVDDVRSVAGLMKSLEPVLEVSTPFPPPPLRPKDRRFTNSSCWISPDVCDLTENRILSIITAGEADDLRGLDRRQPRIPSSDPVEHHVNFHRFRNYPRPQVY